MSAHLAAFAAQMYFGRVIENFKFFKERLGTTIYLSLITSEVDVISWDLMLLIISLDFETSIFHF